MDQVMNQSRCLKKMRQTKKMRRKEPDKNEIFVSQTQKLAVVDAHCTKTAAREHLYKNYVNDLPEKFKN